MSSYFALAVACPDYFTQKTPGPSAKGMKPAVGANLVLRLAEAARVLKGAKVVARPREA